MSITRPLFEEKQKYDQWWLRLIIVGNAFLVIGIFLYGMYVQLVLGEQWGDKPMSNEMLLMLGPLMICGMGFMLYMFFASELEIVVDKTALTYRFFPTISKWRRIERESIKDFELKTWILKNKGNRINLLGNRTVVVKGNQGVKVHMHNGKWVLLGTQKPEALIDALHKMTRRTED